MAGKNQALYSLFIAKTHFYVRKMGFYNMIFYAIAPASDTVPQTASPSKRLFIGRLSHNIKQANKGTDTTSVPLFFVY